MSWFYTEREISEEDYTAVTNRKKSKYDLFTDAERFGYGVIPRRVYKKDGKYYVGYETSDSCD